MTGMHLASRHSAAADVAASDARDWRMRSACRDEDPELFFPVGTTTAAILQAESAKRVCRRCPVIDQCRKLGDELGIHGVYGGTSELDRRTSHRSGQYQRKHQAMRSGRALALTRGRDLIVARRSGTPETTLAKVLDADLYAVRYALRLLLPDPSRGYMEPLERLLVRDADKLRDLLDGTRTACQIGHILRYATHTIEAGRIILAHRDAAASHTLELTA